MVESLLYDKEISVTLFRTPKNVWPGFKSSIIQGYQEGSLNGKKLLYNPNVGTLTNIAPPQRCL